MAFDRIDLWFQTFVQGIPLNSAKDLGTLHLFSQTREFSFFCTLAAPLHIINIFSYLQKKKRKRE